MPQNMRPLQFSRGSLSQIFIELFNLDFTFRYFITTCVVTASILSDVWTGKITLWWCFGYQIHDWNSPSEGETTRLLSPKEAQRHHFSYRVLMASCHDLYRFRGVRISPKSKVELIFPKVIRCNIYIYQYLKQHFLVGYLSKLAGKEWVLREKTDRLWFLYVFLTSSKTLVTLVKKKH